MAKYAVYVFCDECMQPHPMGISIDLKDGPVEKTSIGDLGAGEELPPNVAKLIKNEITCPNTGKSFIQEDNNKVFLVPISE